MERILLAANHVPFIQGGAEYHVANLKTALQNHGHSVEVLRLPFKFQPESDIGRLMEYVEDLDLSIPNGQRIDRLISLQFPTWGISHPNHTAWIIHQHRAVYDLYDQQPVTPELKELREKITAFDSRTLGRIERRFANSERVAERLLAYNGLSADPLYHPPPLAERFYSAEPLNYIFAPSRLESLKRQSLLIEAMRYVTSPVVAIIAGTGGQQSAYAQMIDRYGLHERVRLVGHITEAEKLAWYANALGVFFAPYDEDYGYITLEAMLASKPVITAHDSGGPLEFVIHGETGLVADPDPQQVAEMIEFLAADTSRARAMGEAGRDRYDAKEISWNAVVAALTGV